MSIVRSFNPGELKRCNDLPNEPGAYIYHNYSIRISMESRQGKPFRVVSVMPRIPVLPPMSRHESRGMLLHFGFEVNQPVYVSQVLSHGPGRGTTVRYRQELSDSALGIVQESLPCKD